MRVSQPKLLFVFLLCGLVASGAVRPYSGRYALILSDTAVASRAYSTQSERTSQRTRIVQAQSRVRAQLTVRHIIATGAVNTLLNAVFVQATPGQANDLRSLPGVIAVAPLRRFYPDLNSAIQLVNAPAAWNILGGVGNAGVGVRIAILDTGIDQTHPAFQDDSLPMPPGFPVCSGSNCAFTNNKVIVARSYIAQLGVGSPPDPSVDSRPDDVSPRDRVGHGTGVAMIAAGETNTGPAATITGMAPKAYLGNYKVFGSPGVIDFTSGDVIIQALEDAYNDGMNVAVLSLGSPAFSGPLDTGSICGNPAGEPCDPEAQAAETAAQKGMVVVAAAGNEGTDGNVTPTLNTIGSPGDAPSVLAVGASTNSHQWANSLTVSGLQRIDALFGDGPVPASAVTAPLKDVSKAGGDVFGCTTLPSGSLTGTLVLVEFGNCNPHVKVLNVQAAGAVGLIIYQDVSGYIDFPVGLSDTMIPTVGIAKEDGATLRSYVSSHPNATATIDPQLIAESAPFDSLADFSSRGPSTGLNALKPDLVAVGTDLYIAAENFDPNGELYSANRYTVSQGTSFSAPMAAGAAALVKQKNPSFNTAQIRSALINTASQTITGDSGIERATSVGGGKLNAGSAVSTNVTISPATISLGLLNGKSRAPSQTLTITNSGPGSVNLQIAVKPRDSDSAGTVGVDKQTLTLSPGQSDSVTVSRSGGEPAAGSYEGAVNVTGGSVPLHVPYLYLEGDGVPKNIIPLLGSDFSGTVSQAIPEGIIAIKIIDQYGVPVSGVPVRFRAIAGGGSLSEADPATDENGIAAAEANLGATPGDQAFQATAAGMTLEFDGRARPVPQTAAIVEGAGFTAGAPVAPGSYISLFGTGLSDSTRAATTATLPLNIDLVNVSFDVPSASISVPGRVFFVSSTQVNVQVPWELQGQSQARVKVRIEDSLGNVYTLPLATYSPGLFTDGNGNVAALDSGNQAVTTAHPATRGEGVQLFANGLGPVTNQPESGSPANSDPLSQTTATPSLTIGGQPAPVSFSGLAPGYPGLYQINVTVPSTIGVGSQPVVVKIGGVTAKTAMLPVR